MEERKKTLIIYPRENAVYDKKNFSEKPCKIMMASASSFCTELIRCMEQERGPLMKNVLYSECRFQQQECSTKGFFHVAVSQKLVGIRTFGEAGLEEQYHQVTVKKVKPLKQ